MLRTRDDCTSLGRRVRPTSKLRSAWFATVASVMPSEEPLRPSSEAPWPEFRSGLYASPPPAAPAAVRSGTATRRLGGGPARVVFLLASVVVVTIAGIAIGQSFSPGVATTSVLSTTAQTTVPRVRPPRVAALEWGPLTATRYGTLPVGGDRPGAAIAGSTLVVVGGAGSNEVLAGPVGGKLAPVAKLPQRLAAVQVFALGATVYALGGEQGTTRPTASSGSISARGGSSRPGRSTSRSPSRASS